MAYIVAYNERHWLYKHLGPHSVMCARLHGGAWGWGEAKYVPGWPHKVQCLYAFSVRAGRYFESKAQELEFCAASARSPKSVDAVYREEMERNFIHQVLKESPELYGLLRIDRYIERLSSHARAEELLEWRDFMQADDPHWTLPPEYQ